MTKKPIVVISISLLLGTAPPARAWSQPVDAAASDGGDVKRMADVATDALTEASSSFDCNAAILGMPKQDNFIGDWFVAYSAGGPECDAAQQWLGTAGEEGGIRFLRRPNLSQLRQLLGPMLRAAELSSGCRIAMRGQPVLDHDTARWFIRVTGEGGDCNQAVRDLSQLAGDIDVTVLGGGSQRGILR